MCWQKVIAVAGALLQIAGIALAMWGITSLRRQVFRDQPTPVGRWKAWLLRVAFRRKPHPGPALEGAISTRLVLDGSGFGQRMPPKPEGFEPSEAWIEYLTQGMSNLAELRDRDVNKTAERFGRVENLTDTQLTELRDQVREDRDNVRSWMAGKDGRGLDRAWYGLALTALGAAFQGAASLM